MVSFHHDLTVKNCSKYFQEKLILLYCYKPFTESTLELREFMAFVKVWFLTFLLSRILLLTANKKFSLFEGFTSLLVRKFDV